MATPEQMRESRIEYLITGILEAKDVPPWKHVGQPYDLARAHAIYALLAEEQGEVAPFLMAVEAYKPEDGEWGWRAREPVAMPEGCVHVVQAVDATVAKVMAIRAHQKHCGGER